MRVKINCFVTLPCYIGRTMGSLERGSPILSDVHPTSGSKHLLMGGVKFNPVPRIISLCQRSGCKKGTKCTVHQDSKFKVQNSANGYIAKMQEPAIFGMTSFLKIKPTSPALEETFVRGSFLKNLVIANISYPEFTRCYRPIYNRGHLNLQDLNRQSLAQLGHVQ